LQTNRSPEDGKIRIMSDAPTPLRVLVVEDEPTARNYLVELLTACAGVEVVGALRSLAGAQDRGYEDIARSADAVFIDVHLGGGVHNVDGLAIARALAAAEPPPMLVFATASKDHAMDAIDVGSVAYLHKPFDQARVLACVEKLHARRVVPKSRPIAATVKKLVARSRAGLVFVDVDSVWAFAADTRLVTMHASAGAFDMDLSLTQLEPLMGDRFVRVHRQWLVQVEHIRAMERKDGDMQVFAGASPGGQGLWAPVARERAAAVRQLLLSSSVGLRA
jgi:two-component system, LytTR family, response regulator LytT